MTDTHREATPRLPTPPGACDTHMHIYHPEYAPRPGTNFPALPATVDDYRKLRARLGLTRSVVVQPTAYGNDNRCTLMAMQALGDTRGVAILLPGDSDSEIGRLHLLGVRGLRWVKLSAAYHGSKSGPPRYEDMAPLARELVRAAPERMLWASNWPHPMVKRDFPDDAALLDLVADWAGSPAVREQILVANPARLYGF